MTARACGCDGGLPCGCCEGTETVTPQPVASRPGLSALHYRVGTHGGFFESMLARLSSSEFPALRDLSTREPSDFSIALLDGWAMIADVLTFYQERIANEGYIRTATDKRSVLELARLVGYELRPGVAASVFLAYTLDDGHDVVIPAGSRVQSVPGPGELPQAFETSSPLGARSSLSVLGPRRTRPQAVEPGTRLWFKGIATGLQAGDGLLIDLGGNRGPFFERIAAVEVDHDAQRTAVTIVGTEEKARNVPHATLEKLVQRLSRSGTASGSQRRRVPASGSKGAPTVTTDRDLRLLASFHPEISKVLARAYADAVVTRLSPVRVYAMRTKASVFGHNAPKRVIPHLDSEPDYLEWQFTDPSTEDETTIYLDASYDKVLPQSWIAIDFNAVHPDVRCLPKAGVSNTRIIVTKIDTAHAGGSRAEYGMSGPTTQIGLPRETPWLDFENSPELSREEFEIIRATIVYVQSEELTLAEEPILDDVCGASLELDGLYEGLEPGRILVVSGERADVAGTSGVMDAERVQVANVIQAAAHASGPRRGGDKVHTYIELEGKGLEHCYVRAKVTIHGNVVHATHGETRAEVLGSGNAAQPLQHFALRQSPLTYVSASTPSGVESSLEIRLDDVRWPLRDALADMQSTDRGYIARADGARVTTVVFGDGRHGRRLPTGIENVRAAYRNGIGKVGNLDVGRLTQLATKPLGVKDVTNPVPATGGADADSRDRAKVNAPTSVRAFDRLVSLGDYEDFARNFAGVGKATATRLSAAHRRIVCVTIAGVDDIPIDETSDLLANLRRALNRFGDPDLAVEVQTRRLLLADLSATVQLDPDYEWASVEPKIRAALVGALGFDAREIGQDLTESEVLAVIHAHVGVVSTQVVGFEGKAEDHGVVTDVESLQMPLGTPYHPGRRIAARDATLDAVAREVVAAELLYLSAALPDTLTLTEAKR
jgi:predicted phage baseplate assembly protein